MATILVKSISQNLRFRSTAKKAFERALLSKAQPLVFDFEGVEFISRAFADEFIKQSRDYKSKNSSEISCKNMSDKVARMIEAVKDTQSTRKFDETVIGHRLFNNVAEAKDFMYSW
jgi:anti-anti-sigma regulatory factor